MVSKLQRAQLCIFFILQWPLLAYMANLNFWQGALLISIGVCGLFYLYYRLLKPISKAEINGITMFVYSNLGMLIGWLIDFEGLPLLREDVCLCGCANSTLGQGLCHCLWMYIGMYIGAIPALWNNRFSVSCLLGCLAMGPGMWLGSYVMTFIPIFNPIFYFFLTIFAMIVGMLLGMEGMHIIVKKIKKWALYLKLKIFSTKPLFYS